MSATPLALGFLIVGMGIITYAIRLSLILLLGRLTVPPLVQRALRFVPPAVLSALILPELLLPGGTVVSITIKSRNILTRSISFPLPKNRITIWMLSYIETGVK